MWAAYAGNFSPAASAYCGKLFSCITVGTSAVPRSAIVSIRSVERPVPCSMQSMPPSIRPGRTASPKQCAVTFAPWSWATRIASAKVSGGNDGARSPDVALDPVADQLDPAVAALRLLLDVRRELGRLDLVGVVADVALGPRQVPTGPDQPGQVVAVVDPGGVGGRAAVAQQQRTGVPVGDRLLLLGLLVDGARARRARRGSGRRPARARSSRRRRARPTRSARRSRARRRRRRRATPRRAGPVRGT